MTAAPDVLFLADTDGGGKSDRREVLYTGLGAGNPRLCVNSPTYGLDNWVDSATSLSNNGTGRSTKTGKTANVTGHDVRVRPDTGDSEAGGGPDWGGG